MYALDEHRRWRWYNIFHLVPALLFFIDYLPIYASSNEVKRNIISGMYINIPSAVRLQEGWLVPADWHYITRHLIAVVYVVYIVALLVRQGRGSNVKLVNNSGMLNWLKLITAFFGVFTITGVITYFFNYLPFAWNATVWEPLIMVALLAIALFFKPEILYGEYVTTSHASTLPKSQAKVKNAVLTEDVVVDLQERLGLFMESRHFLRKNIKLGEVAAELKVQPYILSAYINHVYQMRFNDLINFWRIQYVKDGLLKGEWNLLTLEAVSEEAGFNNRTTFLNAFKKFTGMTPTAFMQKTNNHNGNHIMK